MIKKSLLTLIAFLGLISIHDSQAYNCELFGTKIILSNTDPITITPDGTVIIENDLTLKNNGRIAITQTGFNNNITVNIPDTKNIKITTRSTTPDITPYVIGLTVLGLAVYWVYTEIKADSEAQKQKKTENAQTTHVDETIVEKQKEQD